VHDAVSDSFHEAELDQPRKRFCSGILKNTLANEFG